MPARFSGSARAAHAIHYYPVSLNLQGRRAVVIGGGSVAERKVKSLLRCEARVRVVTPASTEPLGELARQGKIELIAEPYQQRHLADAFIVIAATDDEQVNRQVFAAADGLNIPCNVVDSPQLCSFIVPAVLNRGDLNIAVSTNGKSPLLSKMVRRQLEELFGPEYGEYLEILGSLRERVKRSHPDPDERAEVWRRIQESDLLDAVKSGNQTRAREIVQTCL